ncbi:Uncharacterized protein conserved in bacteria (plasmid) [Legionella adelaidensis]|uniref:Uncharacterized protein conserved in bacteria n=1 Tax=Legionella adelaidensis TaxID=45056 RepID=A0A0W0R267_9GAMM|nr:M15 family metallopeptidase [Legionella adelaidensis]KTC65065.1 hypothetical protein Lade_1588 [Legionella adelaidensis]VEH85415.1 Uncharacterized protein conserved in bacteria [Legionella adelaidensis]
MRIVFYAISYIALPFSLTIFSNNTMSSQSNIQPISLGTEQKMRLYTWKPSCPISLSDLREVYVPFWGFDNKKHRGVLIVNKELAEEVVDIFTAIYEAKFPISRMEMIEEYKGNDEKSMAANNTSSFNCRERTSKRGEYSQHSYGRAIDINPLLNPYVSQNGVLPVEALQYANRRQNFPGKIDKKSIVYKVFTQYGWDWGGNWHNLKDYQHFEKRANNKKRNPYG